jgi:hypothetical protein
MSSFGNVIYGDFGDERTLGCGSVQYAKLGTKMVLEDGREFRYSRMGGTAMVQGNLYQGEALAAGTGNIKSIAVIAGSAQAGDRSMSITMSATGAMTKDQYKDGYVFVSAATAGGTGYVYKIKACSSAAASSTSVLTLYDKIETTIAGGTATVGLRVNEHDLCLLTTADTVGVNTLAGVSCATAAASSYCWLQTRGPAAVLTDNTTLIVGVPVSASTTVAGAVGVQNITPADTAGVGISQGDHVIGYCMSVAASAEFSLVDLCIK